MTGVAVGSGLLLALSLKEDKFDAKLALIKASRYFKGRILPSTWTKYNENINIK